MSMTEATLATLSVALSAALAAATLTYVEPTYKKAQAQTAALTRVGEAQNIAAANAFYELDHGTKAPALSDLSSLYLDPATNTGGVLTAEALLKGWEQLDDGSLSHPTTPDECAALERAGAITGGISCDGVALRISYTQ